MNRGPKINFSVIFWRIERDCTSSMLILWVLTFKFRWFVRKTRYLIKKKINIPPNVQLKIDQCCSLLNWLLPLYDKPITTAVSTLLFASQRGTHNMVFLDKTNSQFSWRCDRNTTRSRWGVRLLVATSESKRKQMNDEIISNFCIKAYV